MSFIERSCSCQTCPQMHWSWWTTLTKWSIILRSVERRVFFSESCCLDNQNCWQVTGLSSSGRKLYRVEIGIFLCFPTFCSIYFVLLRLRLSHRLFSHSKFLINTEKWKWCWLCIGKCTEGCITGHCLGLLSIVEPATQTIKQDKPQLYR